MNAIRGISCSILRYQRTIFEYHTASNLSLVSLLHEIPKPIHYLMSSEAGIAMV